MQLNQRMQLVRGTAVEINSYVGQEGELSVDMDNSQIHISDGVTPGGSIVSPASFLVEVVSWAGNTINHSLGGVVSKAAGGSALSIKHNRGKYPTGWFAFDTSGTPFIGILPNATRNIQIVDENEIIITNLSEFNALNISINFS